MLYAKITPVTLTKRKKQDTPEESVEVSYFTPVVDYRVGASKLQVIIRYGNKQNPEGTNILFKKEVEKSLLLTQEDISAWGTDDTVLLHIVASKLNHTILEIVEGTPLKLTRPAL